MLSLLKTAEVVGRMVLKPSRGIVGLPSLLRPFQALAHRPGVKIPVTPGRVNEAGARRNQRQDIVIIKRNGRLGAIEEAEPGRKGMPLPQACLLYTSPSPRDS